MDLFLIIYIWLSNYLIKLISLLLFLKYFSLIEKIEIFCYGNKVEIKKKIVRKFYSFINSKSISFKDYLK